jgi:hypothetical protein
MTFQEALKYIPARRDQGVFLLIDFWRYNMNTGLAINEWTHERFHARSWQEFVIEKKLIDKYIPEWQLESRVWKTN